MSVRRTPTQGMTGCGARHRKSPMGGAAYGMPLKTLTPFASAATSAMRPPSTRMGSCAAVSREMNPMTTSALTKPQDCLSTSISFAIRARACESNPERPRQHPALAIREPIECVYYSVSMAMGKRKRDRQPTLWMATTDFPTAASHPFYRRVNQLLREHGFDNFAEAQCAGFYAETMGRPSLPPGIYFRLLLIGYFEGIDSERGIAWRTADSLALRDFLGLGLTEPPPDHSTISRTRRLIAVETHRAVFTWVAQCVGGAGLIKGKTIGLDATTLEANAAMRSIVRRDTGESYEEFLTRLAKASGIGTPTRADLARLDRKGKKKASNDDWTHRTIPTPRSRRRMAGRIWPTRP